jgi:hypothetical protein
MRFRRLPLGVTIVVVTVLVISGGPAQAATSHDYAGFALIEKGPAPSSSSAATTFTVPAVACTAATSGVIVGSGIYSSVTDSISAGGVVVACQGGNPSFTAQAVVNNVVASVPIVPVPGDTVSTSVVIVPGQTQVTVDDVTQGVSSTDTVAVGSVGTYISNGIDADRTPSVLPVPDFGVITFSSTSINGLTVKAAHAKVVNRKSACCQCTRCYALQIKTGRLNAAGDGYTETFKHS